MLTSLLPPPINLDLNFKIIMKASHSIFHSPLVRQAWSIARVAHAGQARSAAAPSQSLLEHCADVSRAVAELLSGDAEAVAAAVLHEALGRGVATAGALAEVGVPDRVVALVSSIARMSDLCAVRRFTTGEASGSPSGSPVGSLGGGRVDGFASAAKASAATASAAGFTAAPPPAPSKADASAFVAMLLSMSDVRAVVIKLADRLCDLKSSAAAAVAEAEKHVEASSTTASPSPSSSSSKPSLEACRAVADPSATAFPSAVAARDAARDALGLYAPLANRLGVWSLKASLEDAAFALLHPDEAGALAAALAPPERAAASLRRALDALRGKLDAASRQGGATAGGLANADLSGRPKNLYGVYRKMLAKGPGATPASIHDARAVRVLVPTKADCYAALRAVHALWKPADEEQPFKDYIRRPKDNGYQSLHTVVLVADEETGEMTPLEVQIRTAKMHLVAEFGVAAHWRYKEESAMSEANEALSSALGATTATAAAVPNAENATSSSTSSFDGDDAALTSSDFEDAQVAWARWLITWAHELEDKKAKASEVVGAGSGPLAALAGAVGSAVPVAAASSASSSRSSHRNHRQHSSCAFPTHSADCAFVDFMANTLNGRSSKKGEAAAKASSVPSPSSTVATASEVANVAASSTSSSAASTSSTTAERVLVAVLDHTASGRVEAVPAGTTAAQLVSRLAARSSGNNSNGRPPSASSSSAYRASRVRTRVLVNNGELALSVQGGVAVLEENLDGRFDAESADETAAARLSAALKPGDKVELFSVPPSGPSSFDGSDNASSRRDGSIDVEVEQVRLPRLFSSDVAAQAASATAAATTVGGR